MTPEQELAQRVMARAVARRDGTELPMSDEDRALFDQYHIRASVTNGGAIVQYSADAPDEAESTILDCLRRQYGPIQSVLWLPNVEGDPNEQR